MPVQLPVGKQAPAASSFRLRLRRDFEMKVSPCLRAAVSKAIRYNFGQGIRGDCIQISLRKVNNARNGNEAWKS